MRPRVLLCAIALSLLHVSGASAARPASPHERAAILRGAHLHLGYAPDSYRLVVRISTRSRHWAAIYIRPGAGHAGEVQSDVVSVRRVRRGWRRHQVGNGGGCGVPRAVRRDLRLACY